MLLRYAAQRPQRVLQTFRERHKTLAAEHHVGVLKARECQPEMVEPVSERLTRDRDAEPAHVGEVGQAHPCHRVVLPENHIALGTIERPPRHDAAFQCPPHARRKAGLAPTNLLEDRHRTDARCGPKHRHDLAVPDPGERVGTAPSTR